MNKCYVEEIHLGFYIACGDCYAYVKDTDVNACVV
jgi:hypothetical protein